MNWNSMVLKIACLTVLMMGSALAMDVEREKDVELSNQEALNAQLIQAASQGDMQQVYWYINKGADIKATDRYGNTALSIAAIRGYEEICKMLIYKMNNQARAQEQQSELVVLANALKKSDAKMNRDMVRLLQRGVLDKVRATEPYKLRIRAEIMKINNEILRENLLDYLRNL